jgi:hypothetical protein
MNDKAKLQRSHDARKHDTKRSGTRRLGLLAAIAMGSTIAAISATACKAQCVELSERASPLVLQTFAADPGWLLRDLRNKREDLTPRLTGYLVSDISVLPAVRTLASEAPNADRPAIGAALRRAEARCLRSRPEAAQKINEFVRKLEDYTVLSGYSAEVEASRELPAAPLPSGRSGRAVRPSTGLMNGEYGTELKDPFASVPLPH